MGRVRASRYGLEVEGEFWRLWLTGLNPVQISQRLGMSKSLAYQWVEQAGGMPLRDLNSSTTKRYLRVDERVDIGLLQASGLSVRQIAGSLGRSPLTISRELRRKRTGGAYRPLRAQHLADKRARRPKPRKLHVDGQLRCVVQAMLRKKMSPEQISARLKRLFSDDAQMQASPETIYQSIYVQGRGQLRRELAACLRTGRAIRLPQRRNDERRGRIPNMVMISQRPAVVDDPSVPGHWEGDLIIGKYSRSAIGTLVERQTRFLMLLHLGSDHTADNVASQMINQMQQLPAYLRQSMTWDQGMEMSQHARIRLETDMDIYFCDPHSPWQRGSNEKANGRLRQYFPKGTDLSIHTPAHLEFVSRELNDRPPKTLGWLTPQEKLTELLLNPPDLPAVATTA